MRKSSCLLLIFVIGCSGTPCLQTQPIRQRDCVKDDFSYDFYANEDQKRITYCYAELQAIARQYLQEHPETQR